ncbi:hypothetical protein ACMD2_13028 [Ananas comosus]|uniref:Uncharacterized protein n=1 Tax=Ananas comosus TaxID=4615 RepID=A0A199VXG6_ANACO|nr:hypothetical protein ACMD2_13028 [Ananas comosus]
MYLLLIIYKKGVGLGNKIVCSVLLNLRHRSPIHKSPASDPGRGKSQGSPLLSPRPALLPTEVTWKAVINPPGGFPRQRPLSGVDLGRPCHQHAPPAAAPAVAASPSKIWLWVARSLSLVPPSLGMGCAALPGLRRSLTDGSRRPCAPPAPSGPSAAICCSSGRVRVSSWPRAAAASRRAAPPPAAAGDLPLVFPDVPDHRRPPPEAPAAAQSWLPSNPRVAAAHSGEHHPPHGLRRWITVAPTSSGRRRAAGNTWNPRASRGLISSAAPPAASRRRPAGDPNPLDQLLPPPAEALAVRPPPASPSTALAVTVPATRGCSDASGGEHGDGLSVLIAVLTSLRCAQFTEFRVARALPTVAGIAPKGEHGLRHAETCQ